MVAAQSAPSVKSILRFEPLSEMTSADELEFHVTFDQEPTGVSPTQFSVTGGTTATVNHVMPVQGTGEPIYHVVVSGGDLADFNGTVGLQFTAQNQSLQAAFLAPIAPPPPTFESFIVDNLAPKVVTLPSDDGGSSVVRSLTVEFDEVVVVDSGAFELKRETGEIVDLSISTNEIDGKTQATIQFGGPLVDGSGSLIDGRYVLTTLDTHIRDLAGNVIDGNRDNASGGHAVDEVFRLFGDSDGDGDVDAQDYGRFGASFMSRAGDPRFDAAFDFDDDGDVDSQDYGRFGSRFMRRL